MRTAVILLGVLISAAFLDLARGESTDTHWRPNILWIYVDDMSDWVACYGDPIARTPHLDRLADDGIRFDRAFVPAPVCSTTRSAIITGAMQTTYGLHQHRTMIKRPLPSHVKTVPELMRQSGYLTFNEAKDDYNFLIERNAMYSEKFQRPGYRSHLPGVDLSWLEQLRGKRFFGQIQLAGGKWGGETGSKYPTESRFDESKLVVPPQYPDHPVFRDAIARHYEQIAHTDEQVGAIVAALKTFDLWDDTVVIFFTDHGSPLPRSKQFLYDEGLRVPLIIRLPEKIRPPHDRDHSLQTADSGSVRTDLVNLIDLAVTTLALAGIERPRSMEGRNLFATDGQPPTFVVAARDRLGIAVDRIRSIRTDRYRYIRNYKTDRALYQPQYRDQYATFRTLRKLLSEGRLTPLQASYHDPKARMPEELYDVAQDPHQINNLAERPEYRDVLDRHRELLERWEKTTDDKGQYPESRESLRRVYEAAKGNCPAPEFDFLRESIQTK